jgi:hypothetical protein
VTAWLAVFKELSGKEPLSFPAGIPPNENGGTSEKNRKELGFF